MSKESLIERDAKCVWHPYTQHLIASAPIPIKAAKGSCLYGEDGKTYLDMISSWWVNLHGHSCPEIVNAISQQAKIIDHVQFAGITHEPAVELAETLIARVGMKPGSRVFYSDNGSTAVEVALKMCRQFWVNQGQTKNKILALSGGFHGDTLGSMSVGRQSGFFNSFQSWMFKVDFLEVPYTWWGADTSSKELEYLDRAASIISEGKNEIAGLILEPLVQGASGMRFYSTSFLKGLCRLAREASITLIFDEVMTGFYRTGSYFAFQQADIVPDLLCLSKGITGGVLPLGATIASQEYFDGFLGNSFDVALAHGHSFTGNPISCAAANANLKLLASNKAVSLVSDINRIMTCRLREMSVLPSIEKTRAIGGIAAFEIRNESSDYSAGAGKSLAAFAQSHGVLIRPLGNVVYLMPPYCVTEGEINLAFDVIKEYFTSS